MTIEELVMAIGVLTVGFMGFGMFIALCVLTRTVRNYYLNAKGEVGLFMEFMQWKANKRQNNK